MLALVGCAAAAVGLAVAVPAAAGAAGMGSLPNSHPTWATPGNKVAATAADSRIGFSVYLKMRDQAGAEALATAVSDPNSSAYGHYLSPAQVRARFAATDTTVQSVRNWLSSAGFTVGATASNNAYVQASGTAAQIQHAFAVQLNVYSVKGQHRRGVDANLSLPSSILSSVVSVSGLNQAQAKPLNSGATATPATVPPPDGFRNARPCGAYYGQKIDVTDPPYNGQQLPYAPCGYKPGQLRSAYGIAGTVNRGVSGRGQTVAILDAFVAPTLYADAAKYAHRNDSGHPLLASQFSEYIFPQNTALEPPPTDQNPNSCDAAGWYGEQTLDVEAVHAMAPGAHILYVGASDCQDSSLLQALNYVVAGRLADVVSNSYGDLGEDGIAADEVQAWNQVAIEGVLEGMGINFSSGDNGDEAAVVGQPEADFPATDPWVTAVGGTSLGIGAKGQTVLQTGWETEKSTLTDGAWGPAAYLYGSGGGTSQIFAEPRYQRGVVPDALARENQTGNNRGRVVPDISMDGDPTTGMLVGETQTFPDGVYYDQYRIGGTSLSSPLFAGLMAVSNQLDRFDHGFINPVIYQFTARTKAITDVRHVGGGAVRVDYVNGVDASDGTVRSVRTFDFQGLTIQTTPGYDNVTGLGVPNGLAFLLLS
ncbi:MAG TPA: S53 family peptidase [Streptosporangiaceae bacterium]|nr:S53 family peptidase [Streptosporangiaceae bacterium]